MEYDDLCESSNLLKECWERNGEVIKRKRDFRFALRTFEEDVSELKQEYEDCLKRDLTRYLH